MRSAASRRVRETVIFAMLASLMFISKLVMEMLPNIHLLGTLTVLYTVVYRKKALIPIYIYVILNGVYAGFAYWWVGYTYIWAILWGMAMLIPKRIPDRVAAFLYPAVSALHGFAFGILYAPSQALVFGLSLKQMITWIIAGLPFDIIHGISNLASGLLILPLSKLLLRLENTYRAQAHTASSGLTRRKGDENENQTCTAPHGQETRKEDENENKSVQSDEN